MVLNLGTRLGPYEITSQIGAGRMGEVYKARDTCLDRSVAIKVLPAHVASDPDLKQRSSAKRRRSPRSATHISVRCSMWAARTASTPLLLSRAPAQMGRLDQRRHARAMEPRRPRALLSQWRRCDGGADHNDAGVLGRKADATYDVAPDGRFLMIKNEDETVERPRIIINWAESLKRMGGH